MASGYHSPAVRFLVAMLSASDLLLFAKDLFVAAKVAVPPAGAQGMTNGTSSALNSEPGLASIPMAQGGLSRLAIARLKSAGVAVGPLLRRGEMTPGLIAGPEGRIRVRSPIAPFGRAGA